MFFNCQNQRAHAKSGKSQLKEQKNPKHQHQVEVRPHLLNHKARKQMSHQMSNNTVSDQRVPRKGIFVEYFTYLPISVWLMKSWDILCYHWFVNHVPSGVYRNSYLHVACMDFALHEWQSHKLRASEGNGVRNHPIGL